MEVSSEVSFEISSVASSEVSLKVSLEDSSVAISEVSSEVSSESYRGVRPPAEKVMDGMR